MKTQKQDWDWYGPSPEAMLKEQFGAAGYDLFIEGKSALLWYRMLKRDEGKVLSNEQKVMRMLFLPEVRFQRDSEWTRIGQEIWLVDENGDTLWDGIPMK